MHRLRRLRHHPGLRALVRENRLDPSDLILPVFVTEVNPRISPIASMPGVSRWPVGQVSEIARAADGMGLGGILLFGIPAHKDPAGSEASAEHGVVQRAIRELRASGHQGVIVADVCLCEYTDTGHCGILDRTGALLEHATNERLAATALSLAAAGADMVAPSAMMDGMVRAIRETLDTGGFETLPVMAYSAKYASAFYGPFRDAAAGAPRFGDRRGHQLDPANGREAMREHEADLAEGADILMVKPGLACLDIVGRTRERFPDQPLAAYSVSGEYSMIKAAAARGWLDERAATLETLLAFKRAGADIIITYHALEAAAWLRDSNTESWT